MSICWGEAHSECFLSTSVAVLIPPFIRGLPDIRMVTWLYDHSTAECDLCMRRDKEFGFTMTGGGGRLDDNVTYTSDDITYLRCLLACKCHLLLSPYSAANIHM